MSSQRHPLRGIGLLLLMLLPSGGIAGNSDFSAGTAFGRSNGNVTKAQMEKAGNNIGEYVPEFDKDKAESEYGSYYGGVKSSGRDMNAPGSAQFNSTEWGQSIQEHKRKAPDMPGVSAGDDFLKQGQKAIDNAQSMFDPNLCKSVSFDKVTTVNKTCERDLEVSHVCQRIAGVEWHGSVGMGFTTWEARLHNVPYSVKKLSQYKEHRNYYGNFSIPSPGNGYISGGHIAANLGGYNGNLQVQIEMLGRKTGTVDPGGLSGMSLGIGRTAVSVGQSIPFSMWTYGNNEKPESFIRDLHNRSSSGAKADFRISFTFETLVNTLDAGITWVDTCEGE